MCYRIRSDLLILSEMFDHIPNLLIIFGNFLAIILTVSGKCAYLIPLEIAKLFPYPVLIFFMFGNHVIISGSIMIISGSLIIISGSIISGNLYTQCP